MSNKELNDMSNADILAAITEKNLHAAIMTPGSPVYIVDDFDIIEELEDARAFYLDNFFEALTGNSSHFLQRLEGSLAPVILLHKHTPKKLIKTSDILKNAGVIVLEQDANKPFEVIKCADIQEVKAELARQYQNNFSAGGTISEFKDIINSNANTPPIKTGFKILDNVLDGGLYEGLYAIGAISSLGKTTFCLNIAEQIAAKGQDVIIIALEMSKYALIGRSISRLTFLMQQAHPDIYQYSFCKTSRGITDGSRYKNYTDAEKDLINKAIDYYANNTGHHLFIHEASKHFTVDDITRIVKNHIAYTNNKPVVIVDYLQLIQHEDKYMNGNDKIRTDFNLTELKQLSRDYKLPIIAISSFNRAGYNTEVKFECFKESGGIDFSCDVIMGLQLAGIGSDGFNANEAKAQNPREIELVFLKNREAAVGDLIKYYYYPMFNHFEESEEDIRAQREFEAEQAKLAKEQAKLSKAEQLKAEHAELVKMAYDAVVNNGTALITEMVEYLGGKPVYKTLERYIKETNLYTVLGNKVIRN